MKKIVLLLLPHWTFCQWISHFINGSFYTICVVAKWTKFPDSQSSENHREGWKSLRTNRSATKHLVITFSDHRSLCSWTNAMVRYVKLTLLTFWIHFRRLERHTKRRKELHILIIFILIIYFYFYINVIKQFSYNIFSNIHGKLFDYPIISLKCS